MKRHNLLRGLRLFWHDIFDQWPPPPTPRGRIKAYRAMREALESLEAATRGDDGAQTIIEAIQQCQEALAVARQAEALEGDSDA